MQDTIAALLDQHETAHREAITVAEAKLKVAITDTEQKNALGELLTVKRGGTRLSLAQKIIDAGRQRDHEKRKAAQPKLPGDHHPDLTPTLAAHVRRPFTSQELEERSEGLDQLLLTCQECLDAGNAQDAIHAAFEVFRKAWLIQMESAGRKIQPQEGETWAHQ